MEENGELAFAFEDLEDLEDLNGCLRQTKDSLVQEFEFEFRVRGFGEKFLRLNSVA